MDQLEVLEEQGARFGTSEAVKVVGFELPEGA
jgi:hypothetical protein